MNPDDVVGIAITGLLALGGARVYAARARALAARPRLCSCGHGSGPHGVDGCRAPRIVSSRERVDLPQSALVALSRERCGCLAFDHSGERAPR